MALISRTHHVYGLLTVLGKDDTNRTHRHIFWDCLCTCGNSCSIRSDLLKSTSSCGCIQRELRRKASEGVSSSMFNNMVSRFKYYHIVKPLHDAIKERDRHECVICSSRNNLHAHHIFRKSQYKDRITDPNNLVTLCEFCHLYTAHGGNTNTVNLDVARDLLVSVFHNSTSYIIPDSLVVSVARKLAEFQNASNNSCHV